MLVAGGTGYGLRGWVEAPAVPAEAPAAELPSAPHGGVPEPAATDELARLREALARERARSARLESQLEDLRDDAEQLVAAYREDGERDERVRGAQALAPRTGQAGAFSSAEALAAMPQQKGVSLDALAAAGFPSFEAERIRGRIESIAMRQLQLHNQARREGWAKTPRYAKARRQIGAEFDTMREEYGEERFDWILYAAGRKNRVVVDSVFGESAAGEAGLEPGDVILSYADSRVFDGRELRQGTFEGELGELVLLEYERNGETHRVYVPRGPVGVQLHDATLAPKEPR